MPKNTTPVAIVYDFDGTLAPGNAQEPQFIPDIGMKPSYFWNEVDQLSRKHKADNILMYMYLMLEKARSAQVPVRLKDFEKRGKSIELYDGVESWFSRINEYAKNKTVQVSHYIVSSGNAELIEGTEIASEFEQIYASRFMFDPNGVATWPALAINYTTKTQYLFRINKGAHDPSDNDLINQFVEMKDRPIPFPNMIYIGDGLTDVPCFRLVKDLGGLSIAVYKPNTKGARSDAEQFLKEGRVHCVAPADYKSGSRLDQIVKSSIRHITARKTLDRLLAS